MKFVLLAICFFVFFVEQAAAHIPILIEQVSLHDITPITDPEVSKAFYGSLNGFPHTYEIRSSEPFTLFAEVLIPDIEGVEDIVSGIIIKETEQRGKVTEVSRMLARDASWESFFELTGGDSYRRGSSYEGNLDAGVYRIEVTTPNNDQQYVLVVGKEEDWNGIGYFETIRRIAQVKVFFGKSRAMVVQSPFVYVPLGILILIGSFVYYRRRKSSFA